MAEARRPTSTAAITAAQRRIARNMDDIKHAETTRRDDRDWHVPNVGSTERNDGETTWPLAGDRQVGE